MFGTLLAATGAVADSLSVNGIALKTIESTEIAKAGGTLAGGIGSIFLLFVIFYYITSILDGGKFQVKMLMPVLIYILVCNFSWVSGPVSSFTGAIQSGLCSSFDARRDKILADAGCEKGDGTMDIFKRARQKEIEENIKLHEIEEAAARDREVECSKFASDTTSVSDTEHQAQVMKERRNFIERISDAIRNAFLRAIGDSTEEFSMEKTTTKTASGVKYTIMGLLASILFWVSRLMEYVIRFFAGTMTGIIMAFGPLTWAFAIFPGRGKTIETWFIRLCQFALWSPIASLITALTAQATVDMAAALGGDGSLFQVCIMSVATITALTSIPSIAQMILEGASGNIALTSGLQHMAKTATIATSILAAPVKGGAQAAQLFSTFSNTSQNTAQNVTLGNINDTLSNISGNINQMIQGQNTHK